MSHTINGWSSFARATANRSVYRRQQLSQSFTIDGKIQFALIARFDSNQSEQLFAAAVLYEKVAHLGRFCNPDH